MVATPESVEPVQHVHHLAERLAELADSSEWELATEFVQSLRRAMLQVPPQRKAELIRQLMPLIDRIAGQANEEHGLIGEQLTGMRRGQRATAAYAAR